MTKEQLTALVIRYVTGGENTSETLSKYHPQEIELYLELAYNSVIFGLCLNAITNSDYGQLDAYRKSYKNVVVECDTDRDEYYSILPVNIISLPKNRGIFVSPMKDQINQFVDRENNTADIYSELEVGMLPDMITYYRENSKLFYDSRMSEELADNGLLMKLIPTFSSWDDTDELPLPAGKDLEIMTRVLDLLMRKPNEDLKNDNSIQQKR
jgi:hypothetical protein